jgi:hypothetical protein
LKIILSALRSGKYLFSLELAALRGAGFQTCCVADFQVGIADLPPAGLETRDTADLEVCATLNRYSGNADRIILTTGLGVSRKKSGEKV